jgi:hypothetical protein
MTASIRNALPAILRRPLGRMVIAFVVAAAIGVTAMIWQAPTASAHCDSENGPVVTAARDALESGDVDRVLPYVKADQEAELTAAFDQTLEIRKRGSDVRELADQYFVETTVRLHRIGEGASYTGIKDATEPAPALAAAEASLEAGNPDEVIGVLDDTLRAALSERFQGVLDARAAEEADPSVETARERVEAELMFEKYVLDIDTAIHADPHGEPAGEEEHGH